MVMKTNRVYIYRGRDGERAPKRTKKVIIEDSVTIIKACAFANCSSSLKTVENLHERVIKIEREAFFDCKLLRNITLPKNLEYIGYRAFYCCRSLEIIFLPNKLRCVEDESFGFCVKLKIFSIPDTVQNTGDDITTGCLRLQNKINDGHVRAKRLDRSKNDDTKPLGNRYKNYPLHDLCYNTNVTLKEIGECIAQHGRECASFRDDQQMTALHIIASNPYATPETITAIYKLNPMVKCGSKCISDTVWKWILETPKERQHVAMNSTSNVNEPKDDTFNDKYGCNALHLLCEYNASLLGQLKWLEKSINCFDVKNKAAKTPIDILIKNGNITELSLVLALKCSVKWEHGMKQIVGNAMAHDTQSLLVKDEATKLYLFMLAAVGEKSDLTTIYELLLLNPGWL
jgi:hypothetical protein